MGADQTLRKCRALRLGIEEFAALPGNELTVGESDEPICIGAAEDEVQTSIAVSLKRIADAAELVASCVMFGFGDPPEFNTRTRS